MTRKQILNRIVAAAQKANPLALYLFGSYARGQEHKESDVDLLMIVEDSRNPHDAYDDVSLGLFPRQFSMDLLTYKKREVMKRLEWNTFFQSIKKEGILLYGQDVIRMGKTG